MKKRKYFFFSNNPTLINLSHYPRLLPHLAHRCQTTAQASSWSPSPKDFQLLWSTHYAQFSSSDTYIYCQRKKKKKTKHTQTTNSYDMKYNEKEIQFLSWEIYRILKLQLPKVLGIFHKYPHTTNTE